MSVKLVMERFNEFSQSTGLFVNPHKCKIYCGGMNGNGEDQLAGITGFAKGPLPFRYLGIPLTSRKLNNAQCVGLVDKILDRVNHWSAHTLSYSGRVQLLRSIIFATANYWMQCLPLPKGVIRRIEAACRSFLWTGKSCVMKKSPVAWNKVCAPKIQGGLNVINFQSWNKACLIKLLWNLYKKEDSLWIQWVHTYYTRGEDIMTLPIKASCSWIMKGILKQRVKVQEMAQWTDLLQTNRFRVNQFYYGLLEPQPVVSWRKVFFNNEARPRALFILWLACHNRLATKERLYRFGIVNDARCAFCEEVETVQHLLFECGEMYAIWKKVLDWLNVDHEPAGWLQELDWIEDTSKGKNWKSRFLKTSFAETVYRCWKYRNNKIHEKVDTTDIADEIIGTVVHRLWMKKNYREQIAHLLMI